MPKAGALGGRRPMVKKASGALRHVIKTSENLRLNLKVGIDAGMVTKHVPGVFPIRQTRHRYERTTKPFWSV